MKNKMQTPRLADWLLFRLSKKPGYIEVYNSNLTRVYAVKSELMQYAFLFNGTSSGEEVPAALVLENIGLRAQKMLEEADLLVQLPPSRLKRTDRCDSICRGWAFLVHCLFFLLLVPAMFAFRDSFVHCSIEGAILGSVLGLVACNLSEVPAAFSDSRVHVYRRSAIDTDFLVHAPIARASIYALPTEAACVLGFLLLLLGEYGGSWRVISLGIGTVCSTALDFVFIRAKQVLLSLLQLRSFEDFHHAGDDSMLGCAVVLVVNGLQFFGYVFAVLLCGGYVLWLISL